MNPAAAQAAAAKMTTPVKTAAPSQITTAAIDGVPAPTAPAAAAAAAPETPASTTPPAGTAPATTTTAAPAEPSEEQLTLPPVKLGPNPNTDDVLNALAKAMGRPTTTPAAAAKIYELQQVVLQSHKDMLSVWNNA
jgi:hypothetical protein